MLKSTSPNGSGNLEDQLKWSSDSAADDGGPDLVTLNTLYSIHCRLSASSCAVPGIFYLGGLQPRDLGDGRPEDPVGGSEKRSPPEVEVACRHRFQILTAETIKS